MKAKLKLYAKENLILLVLYALTLIGSIIKIQIDVNGGIVNYDSIFPTYLIYEFISILSIILTILLIVFNTVPFFAKHKRFCFVFGNTRFIEYVINPILILITLFVFSLFQTSMFFQGREESIIVTLIASLFNPDNIYLFMTVLRLWITAYFMYFAVLIAVKKMNYFNLKYLQSEKKFSILTAQLCVIIIGTVAYTYFSYLFSDQLIGTYNSNTIAPLLYPDTNISYPFETQTIFTQIVVITILIESLLVILTMIICNVLIDFNKSKKLVIRVLLVLIVLVPIIGQQVGQGYINSSEKLVENNPAYDKTFISYSMYYGNEHDNFPSEQEKYATYDQQLKTQISTNNIEDYELYYVIPYALMYPTVYVTSNVGEDKVYYPICEGICLTDKLYIQNQKNFDEDDIIVGRISNRMDEIIVSENYVNEVLLLSNLEEAIGMEIAYNPQNPITIVGVGDIDNAVAYDLFSPQAVNDEVVSLTVYPAFTNATYNFENYEYLTSAKSSGSDLIVADVLLETEEKVNLDNFYYTMYDDQSGVSATHYEQPISDSIDNKGNILMLIISLGTLLLVILTIPKRSWW